MLELGTETGTQRREVRAGSSYLSRNSLTQSFGVPFGDGGVAPEEAGATVSLDVLWPGAATLRLAGLPSDARIRVVR